LAENREIRVTGIMIRSPRRELSSIISSIREYVTMLRGLYTHSCSVHVPLH